MTSVNQDDHPPLLPIFDTHAFLFFPRVALCLSICLALHLTSSAQPPQPFIGHELGEAFTRHHLVVDYVEHMADSGSRIGS